MSRCLTPCLGGLYKFNYLHAVTLHVVVLKQSRGLVLAPLKIASVISPEHVTQCHTTLFSGWFPHTAQRGVKWSEMVGEKPI